MSYLALYRKFRPNTFEDVIGQEHITTSLKNQIALDTISHAYLFCGTRGTGKTSVAKVFAKTINCTNCKNGIPCGTCDVCRALSDANNLDIMEIDAASNNRVDEIRELREKVKYPPINGKYKVYIIDEVHMLTDSAFNALLKTLEEPPKHVVFILATTEVQKLPATILSRCVRFDFKLVGQAELEKHLINIFEKTQTTYDLPAISLIAKLAEGSVRDMLSIADMCVAYTNKVVTYDAVLQAVGAIDKTILVDIAGAVVSANIGQTMKLINDISVAGKSMVQLSKDMAQLFRDVAVVKTVKDFSSILCYPKDYEDSLKNLAANCKIDDILLGLKTYASLDNEFRFTNNPKIVFEVATLSLCDEFNNQNAKKNKVVDAAAVADPTITTQIEDVVIKEQSTDVKTLFGKFIVQLRKAKHTMLVALIGDQNNVALDCGNLSIKISDKNVYDMLSKQDNFKILNDEIMLVDKNTKLVLKYEQVENTKSVEELLLDKFGKDLTVK